jgi:hypothetical protein
MSQSLTDAPHLPVRSAITKVVVCKLCGHVLTTIEAQDSPCPN